MAKRKYTKWTKEQEAQMVSLRKAGVKPAMIATIMGLPVTAIYNRSLKLNVTSTSAQLEMDFRESPKKVFLSAGQLAIARMVGITPEQYAEQVVLIGEERGQTQPPKPKTKPTWYKRMMWWRN